MAEKLTDVVLRPKRQLTLPKEVCEQLGIQPGDVLELALGDGAVVARPKKAVALDALREIREAFRCSGIAEAELQEAGRRVRLEIATERHAAGA